MVPPVDATGRSEDPWTYLPHRPVQDFPKGQLIYGPHQPSSSLYLLLRGLVKVTYLGDHGGESIARIIRNDGLFGESCLIGDRPHGEAAVPLEGVTLMAWTSGEIEQHVEREPRLGLLLMQHLIHQSIGLQDRIENSASYKTPERVMLAIMQLANDLGTVMSDGSLHLPSLTHHTIAEYVGTSREIVTFQMNRLRRLGMLKYSRKYIDVSVLDLEEELHQRRAVPTYAAERGADSRQQC
jgi:CRP/FNR family cyclic AMP-dependent transcriptional regulator